MVDIHKRLNSRPMSDNVASRRLFVSKIQMPILTANSPMTSP